MTVEAVAAALGGAKVLRSRMHSEYDLMTAASEGLAPEAALSLVSRGLLGADELDRLVLPRRTLDRRLAARQRLTVAESDRVLRAARMVVGAAAALGSAEKAATWLRTANRALRGSTPIALLETDLGARLVERVLGRIEHGVYS